MLFSTMRGVVIVDPARLTPDTFVPPIYIEKAIVNGREQPLGRLAQVSLEQGRTGNSLQRAQLFRARQASLPLHAGELR